MSQPSPKKKILLFDDDRKRVRTWKAKLESVPRLTDEFDIDSVTPERFAAVFEALKDRQGGTRTDGAEPEHAKDAAILDQADIVVVDFDLTPARGRVGDIDEGALRTLRGSFGDTFAYLTRCYTDANYVVLVNQTFYQTTFDLTMREFEYSAADLNITDSDLSNEGLWYGASASDAYRPWHWPRLVDAGTFIDDLASRIDLDLPLLETLGLDAPDVYALFDPQQLEVLGKDDPRAATFRSITGADAKFGRRSENEELGEDGLKRVSAAAVHHWLERIVIPGQNILVDAPHLAQRRPHLVVGEATRERLDALGDLTRQDAVADILDTSALTQAETPARHFTMRPVWLWPSIPRGPIADAELVFCEDVSRFVPIDEAQEFRSELPGPFRIRFAAEVDGEGGFPIDYRPDSRFFEA